MHGRVSFWRVADIRCPWPEPVGEAGFDPLRTCRRAVTMSSPVAWEHKRERRVSARSSNGTVAKAVRRNLRDPDDSQLALTRTIKTLRLFCLAKE